jgi:hypothetical protein
MTIKIFTSMILVLLLASCNNYSIQDKPKLEIPKALEDKNSSYEIVSKRTYEDLVENLYSELVSKNIELKQLEDNIDELNKSKNDTIALFDKFNRKNQVYFSSVDRHILGIKDSLLRNKMKILIANNLMRYNSLTTRHNELLKAIEDRNFTLMDFKNFKDSVPNGKIPK